MGEETILWAGKGILLKVVDKKWTREHNGESSIQIVYQHTGGKFQMLASTREGGVLVDSINSELRFKKSGKGFVQWIHHNSALGVKFAASDDKVADEFVKALETATNGAI